ncbi:MAG TPA: hypothetical protein PKD61_31465, partial [Polyangiaceae bacterium]|nr:hypothetical protein [Polyangiaceae bacterium]
MQLVWTRMLALGAATAAVQCTVVNDVDPCGATAKEVRYSTPSDEFELVGHPQAAARLPDGRILTLYEQKSVTDTSSVRLVVLNPATGGRFDVCGNNADLELSQGFGTRATIVTTDLPWTASRIVAVVAWTEGGSGFSRAVKYQLMGADLCPRLPFGGVSIAPGVSPTDDVALTWDASAQAVWATFHDTRNIYRVKLTNEIPNPPSVLVQGQLTIDSYRTAFAEDGRGFAAWFSSDSTLEFLSDRRRLKALLLGPGAEPRVAAATAAPTAFELAVPTAFRTPDLPNTLSVAAREDRYALAFHGALERDTRPVAHVQEIDAADGRPRGKAWRLDPSTGEGHGRPTIVYLPDDNLLAAWSSPSGRGSVARLFQSGGRARFTGLNCDETRFAIGVRAPQENRGIPAVFRAGSDVWVF